ncbi:MAG: methyltransferase domain-containing protein [Burkholderiales bacterium]
MHDWLETPSGRLALDWQRERLDRAVADIFGFHALQLGMPELDGLRANRMPHRWLALDRQPRNLALPDEAAPGEADAALVPSGQRRPALACDFTALPFPENSLDLVLLPHALEVASDPHAALREVGRVLVPDGRVVICGLNPASLWGLRERRAGLYERIGFGDPYLPRRDALIGHFRLRDWLRLLSFEVESAKFGLWQPAVRSERLLQSFKWVDKLGARWWPIFGAMYFVVAVKRVRGVRLMGRAWKESKPLAAAPVPVANRRRAEAGSTRNEKAVSETE